ncbi:putative glycosyl transferase (group 2 family protein) [Desulforapulum autotrophicum HRM2]|uniref:Glycosyl transferase (Group 2 family protein) n=1 Tax=Desulforapulum autotrophicum (strain ATCC 43914 / DSM 3382 / VKM B-1955 / HRM2) TaxID=177437 RepID=C0QK36_DESAH|nr:glycosyltransferase family 2 protein [Desulforapulum autotrophicum]ACN16062.1 putative glycosyl transferase (group 2 family protein) [Desulforapulum autotrophicum HRM2]
MIDLSVSIVSHNSRSDLELLMPSLKKALTGISSEVLLVDNCSSDGAADFVRSNYPEVILTENSVPCGYGANHNKNLKQVRGKYVLFMNSDMVIMPPALTLLCDFMDRNTHVGLCCPNVLNPDGSLQYLNKNYPNLFDLMIRRFVPGAAKSVFKRRMDAYELRESGYRRSVLVPFVSGCFMFCRTGVIQQVNGFDERYFLYFEDVDLCRKVQKIALTMSCPQARVVHRWERSAHKELKWFIVFVQSAVRYFNKWGYQFF